jgi:hypothetical protein
VQRLDIRGPLRIIAKGLAKHADRFGERRLGDEGVTPDCADQFLFGDELARSLDEQRQNGQHARRERNLDVVPPEESAGPIEGERAERNRPALRGMDGGGCLQPVDPTPLRTSSRKLGPTFNASS